MKSQHTESTRKERFEAYLKAASKRCTPERFAILEAVDACPVHFRAEDVISCLTDRRYHVSAPTVYSTLDLLYDCGMVKRFVISRGCYDYERADTAGIAGHHVHLVCSSCGKVKLLRDAELARSIAARSWAGFTPADYSLNIYGTCSACRRRARRNAGTKQ